MIESISGGEVIFALLLWSLPLVLVIWFVRTLTVIAVALRDIATRLVSLESAIRASDQRWPGGG
jgi:hypothetical protein